MHESGRRGGRAGGGPRAEGDGGRGEGRAAADGEVLRAFFAFEPGEALCAEVAEVAARLRARLGPAAEGLRWTRPEGWHVTLRFLGSTEHAQVAELAQRARAALGTREPFALRLGAALAFPARRPRVLALDLEPHEPLRALAAVLERVAVSLGFPPEERPFRPHLTLARAKAGLRRRPDLEGVAAPGRAVQAVREVALLRSETLPEGARYTPLGHFALGATIHPEHHE